MTIQAILLPVFAEVALIFALGVLLGKRRYHAVQMGAVRRGDVILGQHNWPPKVQAASNAFSNQFEVPVLFFALVPLAIITRKADLLFVLLSWIFVLTRVAHAAIYVTANAIGARFGCFVVGAVVVMVMWVVFAIRILAAPLPV